MFGDALQTAMQKVSNDPITELGTGDVKNNTKSVS